MCELNRNKLGFEKTQNYLFWTGFFIMISVIWVGNYEIYFSFSGAFLMFLSIVIQEIRDRKEQKNEKENN